MLLIEFFRENIYFVLFLLLLNIMLLVFKIDKILYFIILNDIDVLFFIEIWFKEIVFDDIINIINYNLFRWDCKYKVYGGVCFYVKKMILYWFFLDF